MRQPLLLLGTLALLALNATTAWAGTHTPGGAGGVALVVTSTNTADNRLLVYSSGGTLLRSVPTQGQGGVGGNAGGIAARGDRVAVVNFGSGTVTVFRRGTDPWSFQVEEILSSIGKPVSVAFGPAHLYILTTTHVESHALDDYNVRWSADGFAPLVRADGSAAQVGVLDGQLIITEKSNAIETAGLDAAGAVSGATALVAGIPANVNTPLGLVTRGIDAYVTIAHADEISLVRNDDVLTVTGSGTQHAPCWLALDGPFLFSSNSPSKSVSRYIVYGRTIVQDIAVAAHFSGAPTDIAYGGGLAAVIDSDGTVSHMTVFDVDGDGNLAMNAVATIASASANGVAIIATREDAQY